MNRLIFCILFVLVALQVNAQTIRLFELQEYEDNKKQSVGFISVSDIYKLSDDPTAMAVTPYNEDADSQYKAITGEYRKRFFKNTGIKETDIVFIYNYARGKLYSFPVKQLPVVAYLSPYATEPPYVQDDYMIGFEISKSLMKGSFSYCFVYIGINNPFEVAGIKPVMWKKEELKNFPAQANTASKNTTIAKSIGSNFTTGDVYSYQQNGLSYFVRDLVNKGGTFARQLVVVNVKDKSLVAEKVYAESEGSSLAPLNNKFEDSKWQWTGKLFKNKPDVIFDFKYHSFGCPQINFLSNSEKDIIINCDNRH